jgi:ABC-type sugar transport system ATPase subunit
MNLLPAAGPLTPAGAAPTSVAGGDRLIGVRPEAVTLADPAGTAGGAGATVERVEVVGEDAYAYLTLPGGHRVVARVAAARRPGPGSAVRVTVRWADTHVFDATSGRRLGTA